MERPKVERSSRERGDRSRLRAEAGRGRPDGAAHARGRLRAERVALRGEDEGRQGKRSHEASLAAVHVDAE
eukprot:31422-Pelagococcus_subviridis.AAC.12